MWRFKGRTHFPSFYGNEAKDWKLNCRGRGVVFKVSLFILPGSGTTGQTFHPAVWAQAAALGAHWCPSGDTSADTGHISAAGEATQLWTRALDLKLHQGIRHKVLRVLSALESPCQSKGGGILNDPCWLTLGVGWRGAACVPNFLLKKKSWKVDADVDDFDHSSFPC